MLKKDCPRILFISPRVIGAKQQVRKAQPPIGIAYLAAALEQKGYSEILIIDAVVEGYNTIVSIEDDPRFIEFGMPDNEIVEKMRQFSPDLAAISILFSSQTESGLSISKSIKKSFPDLPIIVGGGHASFSKKEIMTSSDSVDFMLVGEADHTFPEFVEAFFGGNDYHHIPGLVWREGSDLRENTQGPFIKDIDELPFPAFHLFPMEKYFRIGMPHNPFIKSERVGSLITSRGCHQNCYFCSTPEYFGRRFRALSSKKVGETVRYMVDKFAIDELQFLDDNFTTDHKRVLEICDEIKQLGLRITFPNAIRADTPRNRKKRLEMFRVMHGAGVAQIGISVEHGDQDFLNNVIGKRLDLREVIATCDLAHEAGMLVHANFMMGFPFENEVNRRRTIEFAKGLDADSFSFSLASPLPGTKLWDIVEENGLFMESFNVNRMVYVYVNIVPLDISPQELYQVVDHVNRELNETAQRKRPETIEKYKLFKGKSAHGDRKYHFTPK